MPQDTRSAFEATTADRAAMQVTLIGGGIASLAAAAFLIRDGGVPGRNITVLEETDRLGGSLDGAGNPIEGYVLRGGRMLESKYLCTFALFDSIPALDGACSVSAEIHEFNARFKTSSMSRLVRDGQRVSAPEFGLSERHILAIEMLALEPEILLGTSSITDHFDDSFFGTNFWLMWCTTFAFQPWHSAVEFRRYMLRFAHMVAGFERLEGILRTPYNQYDSLVRPIHQWLAGQGVTFALNTRVTDLGFSERAGGVSVTRVDTISDGVAAHIRIAPGDLVMVTLGSMTESSSLGSMDSPPVINGKDDGGAWALWERMAAGRPALGHPGVFCNHVDESRWTSFTVTLSDPTLLRMIEAFTGNCAGEGGLVTFADSAWLASIVVPHQPHFIGQPDDVSVIWGYGLSVGKAGDFVHKPMALCSGREILTEILGQLGIVVEAETILRHAICIPCMMPFITSQFLRRAPGDRPQVVPTGACNFAVVGQFCEIADDVVFTVEYSIRSAQTAVYELLAIERTPPAVYYGKFDPRVLFAAVRALHDIRE